MRFYQQNESALCRIQLKHLEALYELLEDVVSSTILAHIDPIYDAVVTTLAKIAEYLGGWTLLEGAWRRFISRYMRKPYPLRPGHIYDYLDLVRFP